MPKTIVSGTSGNEITLPQFGDRLKNGATVIHYTHKHDGDPGWLPNGVVLARYRDGEFVTWNLACSEKDDVWHAEVGHYFQDDIVAAANDYAKRGGY